MIHVQRILVQPNLTQRIFEHRKECLKHEAEYNLSLLASLLPCKNPQPHTEFKKWTPEPWWDNFRTEQNLNEYVFYSSKFGELLLTFCKLEYCSTKLPSRLIELINIELMNISG